MRFLQKTIISSIVATAAFAQLTMDQRIADFQQLVSVYAKRYGPYEWKRDAIGFDLLDIAPWLDKVRATKDDLDFYEVMSEYVASLDDAHDVYALPSNWHAYLNFTVDIFDDRFLVDYIDRTRLPASEYPFVAGYELVSIDDRDAQELLKSFMRYSVAANDRSTARLAAQFLTYRAQEIMPHAADGLPEISTVVFRRPDGALESYRIPWSKAGVLLTTVGSYPAAKSAIRWRSSVGESGGSEQQSEASPPYLQTLKRLDLCRIPDRGVIGSGVLTPVFARSLPPSFVQRLGKSSADPFYSGTFDARGFKIGFIRIPDFQPLYYGEDFAAATFQKEIAYMQSNTDGLVVDVMRNSGGHTSYANQLLCFLMPGRWRSIAFELRATSEWIAAISGDLELAKALDAPKDTIDLLQNIKGKLIVANEQSRGRTEPIPLDEVSIERDPALDSKGNVVAYTKPMIVLIDEMSASAAEVFAAAIQDNGRAPLVGWRTMGAGGNVQPWEAGSYSLGSTSVTESLMIRKDVVTTNEYPAAPYVENIGIRPDSPIDYMTFDNVKQNGKPFLDAFIAALVDQIQKNK